MQWEGYFSLGLCALVIATLVFTRLGPHLVMLAAMILLSVSGILTPSELLAGFSNPGLITVAAMYVVAAGIHGSGGVDIIVNRFLAQPRGARQAMLRLFPPVVLMSAFVNNTPVVATLIPALKAWSKRINVATSKLMIPLSYAAILGGTLTLIGTSTNLIVNGQYQSLTGSDGFSLFAVTWVAAPVVLAGLLLMLWRFPKWLPDTSEEAVFGSIREFTLEVAVDSSGPLVGKTIVEAGLRNLKRVFLVEIIRDASVLTAVTPEEKLHGGDRLIFAGDTEMIAELLRIRGIIPSVGEGENALSEERSERRLVEAVVSPHCDGIGKTIRDARFRNRYGAIVLAVARNGERVSGNLGTIELQAGDTLLLEARPAFVSRQRYNRDFLLINDLETEQPRHDRAVLAWGILVGLVLFAATGILSMLNAALVGAAAMVISGCCSLNQAQKSLDIEVILTIAASFALGAALYQTGVAARLGEFLAGFDGGHPLLLLLITYLLVVALTEVITNNAAAIIMVPIVLEMTQQAGLPTEPFLICVMMAASASFITPLGYQTNLMVYGPGGYHFRDFIKVGLPMAVLVCITAVTTINLLWL